MDALAAYIRYDLLGNVVGGGSGHRHSPEDASSTTMLQKPSRRAWEKTNDHARCFPSAPGPGPAPKNPQPMEGELSERSATATGGSSSLCRTRDEIDSHEVEAEARDMGRWHGSRVVWACSASGTDPLKRDVSAFCPGLNQAAWPSRAAGAVDAGARGGPLGPLGSLWGPLPFGRWGRTYARI